MKSSFFQQFTQGFVYTLAGLCLITRPGLRRFVVVPILVNLLIFILLFIFGLHYFQQFMDWMLPTGNSRWLVWLRDFLWLLFALMGDDSDFFQFSVPWLIYWVPPSMGCWQKRWSTTTQVNLWMPGIGGNFR